MCLCVCDRFKSRMYGQAVVLLLSEGPLLSVRQVLFQPEQPTASSLDTYYAATSAGTSTCQCQQSNMLKSSTMPILHLVFESLNKEPNLNSHSHRFIEPKIQLYLTFCVLGQTKSLPGIHSMAVWVLKLSTCL